MWIKTTAREFALSRPGFGWRRCWLTPASVRVTMARSAHQPTRVDGSAARLREHFSADSPRLIGWGSLDRRNPTSNALCRPARTAEPTPIEPGSSGCPPLAARTNDTSTLQRARPGPVSVTRVRSDRAFAQNVSAPCGNIGNPRSRRLRAFSRKDLRTRFTLIPTRLSSKTPRPKSRAEPSSRAPEGGTTARMRRTDAVQSTLSKTGTRHSRGYRFATFPRQPDESRAFTTRTRFGPQARPHRSAFSSDSGAMSA